MMNFRFRWAILFCFGMMTLASAQQGVGTNAPNAQTALDIVSPDKGLLIPRLSLVASTTFSPPITGIASTSHNGLLVYNTNTSTNMGLSGEGFYYWSGGASGAWTPIQSSNSGIYRTSGIIPTATTATLTGDFFLTTSSVPPTLFLNNSSPSKVGFGTATPSATLTVMGYGEMDRLHLGDRSSITAGSLGTVSTTVDDGDWAVDDNGWYLNRLSDQQTLRTATQTLKLTDSGRMGINTLSPTGNLHHVGTVRLQGLSAGLLSADAQGNLIGDPISSTTDSQTLSYANISSSQASLVLTNTPLALNIVGTGTFDLVPTASSTNTLLLSTHQGISLVDDDGDSELRLLDLDGTGTASDTVVLDIAGSERLRILSDGSKLGIGTATPSATLSVDGYGQMDRLHLGDRSSITAGSLSTVSTTVDDGDWAVDDNGWYLNRLSDQQTLRTATQTLKLTDSGRMGINVQNPTVAVDIVGDILLTGMYSSSDLRYKTTITTLSAPMSMIQRLRPIRHHWNQKDFPSKAFDSKPTVGFIAQEFETVLPELVSTDQWGYKSINYMKLNVVLLAAMQETQHQLHDQSKRLTAVEAILKTMGHTTQNTIYEK